MIAQVAIKLSKHVTWYTENSPLLQLIFMTGTIYSDKIHNPLVTHNKAWEHVCQFLH